MKDVLKQLRDELKENSDEATRDGAGRFFKEAVKPYGVKTALVKRIAKDYFKAIASEGRKKVFALCEDLWKSGWMEESFIACEWSYYLRKEYTRDDFETFERWIDLYVTNWASCDTLCNHTVGAFLDMYPGFLPRLHDWARSENRWMRRASAVSLIIPARQGRYLDDIFGIADILLTDTDDLVQKGYGWMLKAASQAHPDEVFGYVIKNRADMPRTALRYAIEKLPPEMRKAAMER